MKQKIIIAVIKLKQTLGFKIFSQLFFWFVIYLSYGIIASIMNMRDDFLVVVGQILMFALLAVSVNKIWSYFKVKEVKEKSPEADSGDDFQPPSIKSK